MARSKVDPANPGWRLVTVACEACGAKAEVHDQPDSDAPFQWECPICGQRNRVNAPNVDPDAGRVLIECQTCGSTSHDPIDKCPACGSTDLVTHVAAGETAATTERARR